MTKTVFGSICLQLCWYGGIAQSLKLDITAPFFQPEQALTDDLSRHFQIYRNTDQIGRILVNLLETDFSFGLAVQTLNGLRGNQDAALAKMAQTEVNGSWEGGLLAWAENWFVYYNRSVMGFPKMFSLSVLTATLIVNGVYFFRSSCLFLIRCG